MTSPPDAPDAPDAPVTMTSEGMPALVRTFEPGWTAIASTVLGGGIGPCHWWLNLQVPLQYHEPDPASHVQRIAASLGVLGPGVGMLTAASVDRAVTRSDGGVDVVATVGISLPVWAASPPGAADSPLYVPGNAPYVPGTINTLVVVPVPLSDAALVNAVITATEAKTQALVEAGVHGTGTASDAICIACPRAVDDPGGAREGEPYGGPRSTWGACIARSVHAAVLAGSHDWLAQH